MKNIDIPYCELNKMKNCYLLISLTMFLLGSSHQGFQIQVESLAQPSLQSRWPNFSKQMDLNNYWLFKSTTICRLQYIHIQSRIVVNLKTYIFWDFKYRLNRIVTLGSGLKPVTFQDRDIQSVVDTVTPILVNRKIKGIQHILNERPSL